MSKNEEIINTKEYFSKLQELSQKYQSTLQNNLDKNEKEQENIQNDIETTKDLIKQLESISERPEWQNSFIPINSLAYIPATIFHTSEYYVKLGSESYTFMCLKEVLNYLERKIDNKEELLDAYKDQYKQFEERFNAVSTNSSETTTETKDMPAEIVSEMGTAYKTASGFYEIIEAYAEDKEEAFYKKRIENKLQKKVIQNTTPLDELENEDQFILEKRVRAILKKNNVYQQLLNDDVISSYCDTLQLEPEQNEVLLNDLIIKALVIEPTVYKAND